MNDSDFIKDALAGSLGDLRGDVKEIRGTQSRMAETLAAQAVVLKDHTRRSLALEKQVEELKKFHLKILGALAVLGPVVSAAISWGLKKYLGE